MLAFSPIASAPIGGLAAVASLPPDPPGEGIDATKVPTARVVVFAGGIRTVVFPGGIRTVRF